MCSRFWKSFTIVFFSAIVSLYGQNTKSSISGKLLLDDSWSSTIYLSHIPTFDDMYVMSSEMIVARTVIDSLGYFSFDIDFLPVEDNLFRIHLVKKDDSAATLIIGGKDENHLFLVANRFSVIQMKGNFSYPPFKNVIVEKGRENMALQQVANHFFKSDSLASESSASKRLLIEKQLEKDLFFMADTSTYFLVSLFAIYKNRFADNYSGNEEFYVSYLKKWRNEENAYFSSFKKQLPNRASDYSYVLIIVSICILSLIIFLSRKHSLKEDNRIKKLSIQERKIYEMLQQGASNQEIANQFNIGLSTVKTHVSSIYSKLNVKSRKGIVNMK